MISENLILRIGRILGLDHRPLAKKMYAKYRKLKMGNHHGIIEKEIQGSRMFLDLDDTGACQKLFFDGVQSFSVTSCIYNELEPNMTFFDIGANFGCYTLQAAKLCGDGGSVIAFEPAKKTMTFLQNSISLNSYKNIKLVTKAISDKSGKTKLFLNPYTSADNRIIRSPNENRNSIDIETISLDDFIKENNITPDFIKIDVQRAEFKVLSGMTNLLKSKHALKFIVEFSPRSDQNRMNQFTSCLKQMQDFGFSIYYLKEPHKMSDLKSKTLYNKIKNKINNINDIGISKHDEVDILFIRK